MRSHTGAIITLRKGAIILNSTKQKVQARSLAKSEMITADNTILKVLWTNQFIEAQRHKIKATLFIRTTQVQLNWK
jgi:hypothetical protein